MQKLEIEGISQRKGKGKRMWRIVFGILILIIATGFGVLVITMWVKNESSKLQIKEREITGRNLAKSKEGTITKPPKKNTKKRTKANEETAKESKDTKAEKAEAVESKIVNADIIEQNSETDWFKTIFGFEEHSDRTSKGYKDTKALFSCSDNVLTSLSNGESFAIGSFNVRTLRELREIVSAISRESAKTTFRKIKVTDILDLHSQNPFATFQAASQANALEFVAPNVTPEYGVTIYASDLTQGPACALACAAGTVYRNYFAPVNGKIGQTASNQINYFDEFIFKLSELEDGKRYMTVKNGYLRSTAPKLIEANDVIEGLNESELNELTSAIKIGIHEDVGVTFSRRFKPCNKKITVTQVYAAAPDTSTISRKELWAPITQLILNAQYEATILAAFLNKMRHIEPGANIVYLTQVGGGVFECKPEWIRKAIRRAVQIAIDMNLGLDIREAVFTPKAK